MPQSVEPRSRSHNEITIVDLAAIFIRRRRIFYIVFVLIIGLGVAYALLATEKYEYLSLVEAAGQEGGDPIEKPATTIATLESRWLPETQSVYQAENNQHLPFELEFSNPENTNLLRLRTVAAKANADTVQEIHNSLIDKVRASQNSRIERKKNSLAQQIESLEKVAESLSGQPGTGEAIAAVIQERVSLESNMNQMTPVEVLVVSRESADKNGPDRLLIVIVAVLLAGTLGVFLAFMAEFVSVVRVRIAEGS